MDSTQQSQKNQPNQKDQTDKNEQQQSRDQRKQNVIDALNKARGMELYSVTQYMHQHYILDDEDFGKLAANIKLIAIDEMRHAERFAERIKDLGGEPTTSQIGDLARNQTVYEVFPFNDHTEQDVIDIYNELYAICRQNGDTVSMRLFGEIIDEEQVHQTYFQNEANHIKNLGETYLSKIAGTSSSTGADSKSFVNKDKKDGD